MIKLNTQCIERKCFITCQSCARRNLAALERFLRANRVKAKP